MGPECCENKDFVKFADPLQRLARPAEEEQLASAIKRKERHESDDLEAGFLKKKSLPSMQITDAKPIRSVRLGNTNHVHEPGAQNTLDEESHGATLDSSHRHQDKITQESGSPKFVHEMMHHNAQNLHPTHQHALISAKVSPLQVHPKYAEDYADDQVMKEGVCYPEPSVISNLQTERAITPFSCGGQILPSLHQLSRASSHALGESSMQVAHSNKIPSDQYLTDGYVQGTPDTALARLHVASSPVQPDVSTTVRISESDKLDQQAMSGNESFPSTKHAGLTSANISLHGMQKHSEEITNMPCTDYQLVSGVDSSWGNAQGVYGLGPTSGRFSFQRLINGDITGFEKEFEEDSDGVADGKVEDHVQRIGAQRAGHEHDRRGGYEGYDEDEKGGGVDEELESDMHSTVYTVSSQAPNNVIVAGFDVESEEDSDGNVKHKVFERNGQEDFDGDMYSTAYTGRFVGQVLDDHATTMESESQTSDDMYKGHKGISKFSMLECNQNANLHKDLVSEFSKGNSLHAKSPVLYGSPTLQSEDHSEHETSSDSSRDLYPGGENSSRKKSYQGSPCLHPVMHSACPTSPDYIAQRFASSNKGIVANGNPCLHPVVESEKPNPIQGEIVAPNTPNVNDDNGENVSKESSSKFPNNVKALLMSGLLDGRQVSYKDKFGEVKLTGTVKSGGILCDCRLCKGRTVVNISMFERHAGSTARHPSEFTFLETGVSLSEILKCGMQIEEKHIKRGAKDTGETENAKRTQIISTVTSKRRSNNNISRAVQTAPPSQLRDMTLHKMLFLPGGLPDGAEVGYYFKGQCILTGRKEGHGIFCGCCNEVVSCSLFEAHAGWGSRRNPYSSIYLSDGQSLHQFAQSLAAKRQEKSSDTITRDNDDVCAECGDGGSLVLCDGCPAAYHIECVGLASIPAGDWYCPSCGNMAERANKRCTRTSMHLFGTSGNRKQADRCQKIVRVSKNAIGGCVICKNGDFLKSGFGEKTVLLCDQCEREYHVGCMKEKGIVDLQELPEGEWFCGPDCTRIHKMLQRLVLDGPKPVHRSICTMLRRKYSQEKKGELKFLDSEFSWQLLHGRRGDPENGRILSKAASILMESFDPILDTSSGRDLISLMVHSRSIRDQDFQGMYCAVLKWKEVIVSTAIIRIFGQQFAELPLVATNTANRGQGFFQILMLSIERLLGMLEVKYLILPAAEETQTIWKNKFGFSKINDEQLQQFASQVQIVTFQGSSMLLKSIRPESASSRSICR